MIPYDLVKFIEQEVAAGYINAQKHPDANLYIFNYSPTTQWEWRWNDATTTCRGLIVNGGWEVIARPFRKFFAIDQLVDTPLPNEPFEVYEKLDGSLGILYFLDGQPWIATRGSFMSTQAVRATQIYREKYAHIPVDPNYTYLFEIIFPENRIVVNYGDTEDLILIAVIDKATGLDVSLPDIGFNVVKRYTEFNEISALLENQDPEREGYVAKFQSGFRVKIKFDEYKRLHKLITGVSARDVWEAMRMGQSLKTMAERVPDEFYKWIQDTEANLRAQYAQIEQTARENMRYCPGGSRKEQAEYIKLCQYPSVMFKMLDNRYYGDIIWQMIKPSGNVFKFDNDADG